ncbi:MAG: 50S ribosomal protein L23 [Chlamydiia bacterium]|nr:50S ribosomal protein L23 [Chlamydiia bacterium]
MPEKNPYQIVKHVHITEKSSTLHNLQSSESNPSVRRCKTPKYVFIVDKEANKREIAQAVEEIYRDQKIKVISVNTIRMKPKKRRVRGRVGFKPGFKKAIVTLSEGDSLENV